MYRTKLRSMREAVDLLRPDDTLVAPIAGGQPAGFLNALAERSDYRNLTIFSLDLRWPHCLSIRNVVPRLTIRAKQLCRSPLFARGLLDARIAALTPGIQNAGQPPSELTFLALRYAVGGRERSKSSPAAVS